ncbi:(Fe-S)-binding protein [Halalkalibacterium halodurans]|uniref:Glycolate oxidase iron-sulfur subunit n=1 Tax=Halalkalibacterium halodurans TaxID=86665 RepID=A0A0M0KJS5_ALKHA|nr:(Fe-S)-binding protein [Halalkalibacterium halodurans]TPE68782.1 (Fe-S)-binding protein [Halalkalibacterium halodurans]
MSSTKQLPCSPPSLTNYHWSDHPDPNKWADCVHCGMCLEACPTYELTGHEQQSPRGRVHLIKSVAEGKLEVNEAFADPVFTCLDCRACETACPADVEVGGLIEEARGQIRQALPLSGWKKVVSHLFLRGLFPYPHRLHALGSLVKVYQKVGIRKAVRKTGLLHLFPEHFADMEAVIPEVSTPVQKRYRKKSFIKAKGKSKQRVALLAGCVMDVMFSEVNEATIRVLTRNGNDVSLPKDQTCCGALHVHAGDREMGRRLAKQNMKAFENEETIIVNAAGCGSMLQEYPELFREVDREWYERAEAFAEKVKDVSKHLYDTGYEKPKRKVRAKVAYHDACHLAHGQNVRQEPRDLLLKIPGVELIPMENADRCCGSAGIYNLTHPKMASRVLEKKMECVPSDVEMVSMGNPGCMLQMAMGVKKYGGNQRIIHTVQLLDLAYQQEELKTKGGDGL